MASHADCPVAPAPFQNLSREKPDKDGSRGHVGEWPRRFVENEVILYGCRLVAGAGQHRQSERANTSRKNGGGAGTVCQSRGVR
jgi:hypothetical protein